MTVGLTVGSGPVCPTVSVPPALLASGPDRGLDNTEGWFSDPSTRPVYKGPSAVPRVTRWQTCDGSCATQGGGVPPLLEHRPTTDPVPNGTRVCRATAATARPTHYQSVARAFVPQPTLGRRLRLTASYALHPFSHCLLAIARSSRLGRCRTIATAEWRCVGARFGVVAWLGTERRFPRSPRESHPTR